jgi:hypothetical protein
MHLCDDSTIQDDLTTERLFASAEIPLLSAKSKQEEHHR